jgi:transposase
VKASRQPSSSKPVLEVLRTLLDEDAKDQVLGLVAELVARNEELELALAKKLRAFKTTEKVSPGQLTLLLEKVANDEAALNAESPSETASPSTGLREMVEQERQRQATEATKPPPKRPSRKPFPASLERVDQVIPVPDAERPCPDCGNERRCIGHDVTEMLELVPAKVQVQRHHREKLVCDACDTPNFVRAPRGDQVVEGGLFGPALVGQLLVDKYRDGLPLHRQRERFRRMGVDLSVSTLADQVAWGAELLQPLWRALQIAALNADVLHLDATSLPFFSQEKGSKKGKKLGALWGYVGDEDVALYLFAPSGHARFADRHTIGPADFLGLRTGLTVADAASVFEQTFARDDIIECGCNMHARRYFVKALDAGDSRAALAIDAYQVLYRIEREARELSPDERLQLRQERSAPIFAKMLEWVQSIKDDEPPSSGLGRALRYFTNQSAPLGRFLEDGRVPIDNGIVERLHVRAALTRKNYLFAGSERGAQSAAVIYSVLGSCALCDVDPVEYLREVIPILARGVIEKDVARLLPRSFART